MVTKLQIGYKDRSESDGRSYGRSCYRGHPLRRVDNLIYYGSMADKYIVMMQVLDTTPLKDITLAKRVSIQLQMTDASLRSRDRVVRSTEKGSLGEAMEFASIWLERALSGKM